jgi:hypothetical protein
MNTLSWQQFTLDFPFVFSSQASLGQRILLPK